MVIPRGASEVTEQAHLVEVAGELSSAREVAVDVEADAMHHFRARLCFVQLATQADVHLVDALAGVDVKALGAVFESPHITKYFHAAQGDLTYLAEAGVRVQGLFDTHRAATLLGWPKVGLADLVLQFCGVSLKKEHQQADFSLRPLPPELKEYIADDVRYLVAVGRTVHQACVEADIAEEVALDCERLCQDATQRPDPVASFDPRLPRGTMSEAQYLVGWHLSQALHRLRLQWAEAEDVPTGRMLSNMALTAIATRPPHTVKELARRSGIRGALVRTHGEEILAVIARVEDEAARGELAPLPARTRGDPRKKKREEALWAWRKVRAAERKVTPSVVLPNQLVDDLAERWPRTREELARVPFLGPKRLALYGDALLAVMDEASS